MVLYYYSQYYAPTYEEYHYDDQSRLLWMEVQDAQRRCGWLYTYDTDVAGNILEERRHEGCRPTDPVAFLKQYTWDAEGRKLSEYSEDFAGLGVGPNYLYTWTYDERGNLTSERYDRLSAPAPIDDRYTTWTWECP